MAVTDWLIDKSALVRLGGSRDAVEWADRIERGLVRISTVTRRCPDGSDGGAPPHGEARMPVVPVSRQNDTLVRSCA